MLYMLYLIFRCQRTYFRSTNFIKYAIILSLHIEGNQVRHKPNCLRRSPKSAPGVRSSHPCRPYNLLLHIHILTHIVVFTSQTILGTSTGEMRWRRHRAAYNSYQGLWGIYNLARLLSITRRLLYICLVHFGAQRERERDEWRMRRIMIIFVVDSVTIKFRATISCFCVVFDERRTV